MLFRVFWDTGGKGRSNAVISTNVQFFQRGKNIKKADIKYHQVLPLLNHGFSARVLAFLIGYLIKRGVLNKDDLTVDAVENALDEFDMVENDVFFQDL